MSEQTTPSLLEQLQAHHQAGYLSLHMPGHKENAALAPYLAQLGAEWDITELPGFDDLHAPEGILAKMMDRAAALWGSRKSCLLVNGSTGGLLAAMGAAGLCSSNREARQLVQQGGVLVDGEKVTDPKAVLTVDALNKGVVIKKGKKVYHKVTL